VSRDAAQPLPLAVSTALELEGEQLEGREGHRDVEGDHRPCDAEHEQRGPRRQCERDDRVRPVSDLHDREAEQSRRDDRHYRLEPSQGERGHDWAPM
jgi:hypothetical protein